MIVDNKFYKFTVMDYIADDTKLTDHSMLPDYVVKTYYNGLPNHVVKKYYVRPGTKE